MKTLLAIALLSIMQSCNTNNSKSGNEITGSWKIVADQLLDSTDHVIEQDTNVAGLIVYLPEGKMSAQFLWKGRRAAMINDTIMKQDGESAGLGLGFNTWTGGQARKLIDTYDSYFGDYSVDGKINTVTHIVTGNLRPEQQGTLHKRFFRVKGDSLFLRSTNPLFRWQVACVRNKN